MRNAFKEDLDGDGNAEDIELFYERGKNLDLHGSLYISINKSKVLIMEEDWFTMPYRIVGEMPKVSFLKEKNGNSKAVLVIYSWATNGVGSTGELYAYKFTDGQISELTVKEPEKIMTYNGNDILDIKYPELNKNFDLRVDPILYKQIHGTEENAEKHPIINDIFSFHTLWYIVNDFNGDAVEELCRVSIPYKTPIDYCYEYIYYEYEKGEIKPVQAIYAPTYGEDKKNASVTKIGRIKISF